MAEGVAVTDGEAFAERVAVGVRVRVGDCDGVLSGEGEAVGVAVGEGDTEGLLPGLSEALGVGEAVGELATEGVPEGERKGPCSTI